jgi:1-acyl-sn-glycerol-3-phosphate acyltransferase
MGKALLFGLTASHYFITAGIAAIITSPFFHLQKRVLAKLVSLHARFCLFFMGINVQFSKDIDETDNYLIIANHLSYIDVLILAGKMPMNFVTSVEIKQTKFLGQIALLAGCLFVERRNRQNLSSEIGELTNVLKGGSSVVVFPEATSTDGSSVLRFRRPLFQAAIDSGVRVLPLCLNYQSVSGESVSIKNRDKIFWYGDMSFGPHLLNLFKEKSIVVQVDVLPIIETQEASEMTALAEISHQAVASAFRPIYSL